MKHRLFGSVLILAGTCIGAGMLALPVSTAALGFAESVLILALMWLYMCYTGLLVVEANLWMPEGTNFISMARKTLGRPGEWACWVGFMLLLYSLMAAYITGGGAIVSSAMALKGITITPLESYVPWILVFAFVIYLGTRFTDLINRLLMLGLIVTYALLATVVSPHIHFHLLDTSGSSRFMLAALPVLITSFGYHIVLPSMRDYLGKASPKLVWTVFLGSLIPFVAYVLWEALIFGVVPLHGAGGLLAILKSGQPTNLLTQALVHVADNPWISRAARFFAFFALASSFVGVALGLFDILADGLKVKKSHIGRLSVCLLTFVPPLIYALVYPDGFIIALGYAGLFVALLHGVLPAAMVWSGRYKLKIASGYRVFGGKLLLIIVILIALLVVTAQLGLNFHLIPVA